MSDLTVRPIASTDYVQWLPLWHGYHTFYKNAVSDEVTAMTWSRFFDAYEPMGAFVAEHDGRLIGTVHYIFHRNTWMIQPVTYLQDLFTAEDARGKGVGRQLIEAVYGKAREVGSPRVYWMTHESNAQAMELYEKVADRSGFIQYRKPMPKA